MNLSILLAFICYSFLFFSVNSDVLEISATDQNGTTEDPGSDGPIQEQPSSLKKQETKVIQNEDRKDEAILVEEKSKKDVKKQEKKDKVLPQNEQTGKDKQNVQSTGKVAAPDNGPHGDHQGSAKKDQPAEVSQEIVQDLTKGESSTLVTILHEDTENQKKSTYDVKEFLPQNHEQVTLSSQNALVDGTIAIFEKLFGKHDGFEAIRPALGHLENTFHGIFGDLGFDAHKILCDLGSTLLQIPLEILGPYITDEFNCLLCQLPDDVDVGDLLDVKKESETPQNGKLPNTEVLKILLKVAKCNCNKKGCRYYAGGRVGKFGDILRGFQGRPKRLFKVLHLELEILLDNVAIALDRIVSSPLQFGFRVFDLLSILSSIPDNYNLAGLLGGLQGTDCRAYYYGGLPISDLLEIFIKVLKLKCPNGVCESLERSTSEQKSEEAVTIPGASEEAVTFPETEELV